MSVGPVDCGTCDDRGCSRCLDASYRPVSDELASMSGVDRAEVARDRLQLRAARELIRELVHIQTASTAFGCPVATVARTMARARRWIAADEKRESAKGGRT